MAARVLEAAGASPRAVTQGLETFARRQPQVVNSSNQDNSGTLVIGQALAAFLPKAAAQRSLLTDEFLSAEHVLLALLNDDRVGRAVLAKDAGLTTATLRAAIDQVRGNRRITSRTPENQYDALKKYTKMFIRPRVGREEIRKSNFSNS